MVKMCPRCGKNKAVISRKYGVLPCESCLQDDKKYDLQNKPEFYTLSKADRVIQQRDAGAKDLLQPFLDGKGKVNPEFAKAYPEQAPNYFSEEQLKKI